jgi:hypothetical protein
MINVVIFTPKRVNIYGNFSCLDVRKFASGRAKISIKWEENLHQDARKFLSRGKKSPLSGICNAAFFVVWQM